MSWSGIPRRGTAEHLAVTQQSGRSGVTWRQTEDEREKPEDSEGGDHRQERHVHIQRCTQTSKSLIICHMLHGQRRVMTKMNHCAVAD